MCAVSMALWRSFTIGAVLLGGGVPCALCAVFIRRPSLTAYAVLVGGVRALCVVCVVSMVCRPSSTAGAVLLGGGAPCALCERCSCLVGARTPFVPC